MKYGGSLASDAVISHVAKSFFENSTNHIDTNFSGGSIASDHVTSHVASKFFTNQIGGDEDLKDIINAPGGFSMVKQGGAVYDSSKQWLPIGDSKPTAIPQALINGNNTVAPIARNHIMFGSPNDTMTAFSYSGNETITKLPTQ